jgi:hypothetical protein
MIRSTALAAALALLTTSAAACGGSDDSDEVKDAAHAFFRDVSTADGERACGRLMDRARRQFVADITIDPETDCARAIALFNATFDEQQKAAIARVRVREVEMRGDRAEIHDGDVDIPEALEADRNDRPMVFRRVRGRWLIEDVG